MISDGNAKDPNSPELIHGWIRDLFPILRSLTGPGVRETLSYLQGLLPGLEVKGVPSGTRVFDWEVPDEWSCRAAYVANEAGERVIDMEAHNLHVVGYSEPVDQWVDRRTLDEHLYSLPDQPDAIPYVTSYYSRRWGFCVSHEQRLRLPEGMYRVVIDSTLGPGVLNYGELVLPGMSDREVMLSTYVCHPSMANNELSGPTVVAALARWIAAEPRRYTYRLVFLPETIGSIAYLSQHLDHLKAKVDAGFVVTCVGDDRKYSYLPSRTGETLADRTALAALESLGVDFDRYSFLQRGSDERQYCSPLVDLPFASVMRSKYCEYPEYHTSLDDLDFVTPAGLWGGYTALKTCLQILEANRTYRATIPCEPQMGKRGLYPPVSVRGSWDSARPMMDVLALADGRLDLIELARATGMAPLDCAAIAELLEREGLLSAT